jgi:hypothetical protein
MTCVSSLIDFNAEGVEIMLDKIVDDLLTLNFV